MSYQLSTSDLDPILSAIEQRLEETKPSLIQVVSSRLLLAATFGHVLTYLLYLTGVAPEGLDLVEVAWAWVGLQVLFALLSWRYLPVVRRQRKLYRDLQLLAPDPTPGLVWKSRTPTQQALARGATGVVLVAILGSIVLNLDNLDPKEYPPLALLLVLICLSARYVWSDRKISLRVAEKLLAWTLYGLVVGVAVLVTLIWGKWPWEDWLVLLLFVMWPAWLLVKSRQVARIQERFAPLARAGGLRDSLRRRRKEAADSGSDSVSLPPEEVARLAYAESEMIRQDRVEAIGRSKTETRERWAVYMADAVHDQLRTLAATERLAVQDTISALSAAGAGGIATDGEALRTLEVPGTSVGLRYRLDGGTRRVTVVELVSSEARSDG